VALTGTPGRAFLAGTLWPDHTEAHAHDSLRALLFRVRRNCDLAGALVISESSIQLSPAVHVDVVALARLAKEGGWTEPPGEFDLLNCGDLLPGWYDEWVDAERERLRQLRLHALERLAERRRQQGRHAEALDAALAAVRIEPLRESSHRLVMQVHLQEGNVTEALREYRDYGTLLQAELRLSPSASMTELVRPYIPSQR
jgi:DNA-binding SARP family transcriptional activator